MEITIFQATVLPMPFRNAHRDIYPKLRGDRLRENVNRLLPKQPVCSKFTEPTFVYPLAALRYLDIQQNPSSMTTTTLKIVVIDDNRLLHQNYRSYFDMYLEYELKGIFNTIKEALNQFETLKPDIIFSEVSLQEECGIQGIKQFRQKDPNLKIIMLSEQNDFELVKTAFKNSANGYLTKPVNERTLYNALDSIKCEGATLSNDIAKKFVSMFQRKTYHFFSERENQVIEHLSQGATYKTIAEKLFVTASAINFHVQNIYLKLDVNSKSEALSKLRELEYSY